jgi:hypothetical protein
MTFVLLFAGWSFGHSVNEANLSLVASDAPRPRISWASPAASSIALMIKTWRFAGFVGGAQSSVGIVETVGEQHV